ncbi:hypothetical protein P5673_013577 [Acropora cervicornis]|uniref:Uncharacterized protein n=1 Tax=Acropora cervicornis TaxID=6130 RepID=A0AAD9V6Q3_ACRCE|nr:hypothetical protein P5673_013577 [Acropora cervicornis]
MLLSCRNLYEYAQDKITRSSEQSADVSLLYHGRRNKC